MKPCSVAWFSVSVWYRCEGAIASERFVLPEEFRKHIEDLALCRNAVGKGRLPFERDKNVSQ